MLTHFFLFKVDVAALYLVNDQRSTSSFLSDRMLFFSSNRSVLFVIVKRQIMVFSITLSLIDCVIVSKR